MPITTQVNEPSELFAPYLQGAAESLQNTATQPYTPYAGELVAGVSPLERQAFNNAANYQLPGQYQGAGAAYNTGITGLASIAGYTPQQISSGYQAQTFGSTYAPTDFSRFADYKVGDINSTYRANQTTGGVFDGNTAQFYMNPYQQGVTDITKRETEREFQKQQSQLRARAAAAGAFGGSRATLLETENQRNQNQLLTDIQTKGLQDAYLNAQNMFGQDREAALKAFGLNEAARQQESEQRTRAQTAYEAARLSGGQLGLDASRLGDASRQFAQTSALAQFQANEEARRQQAVMAMEAQRLSEANRLSGAQVAQRGFEGILQGAQGLGSLGSQIDSSERARVNQLADLGLQQRQQQQAMLDAEYRQYLDERGYGLERANAFAQGIGNLSSRFGVQSTATPGPSQAAQTLGNVSTAASILGQLFGQNGVFRDLVK